MKAALSGGWRTLSVCLLAVLGALPACAEPVSLRHMVDLALTHSSTTQNATLDQQHADAAYRELRNYYLPQFIVSSGLGASYGFPLALAGNAPSIVNLNAQSTLINLSLRDYVRAAKSDVAAAGLEAKDQRNQVIQDTVTSYAELSKWQGLVGHLQQEQESTKHMEQAVEQRIQAGVDSAVERSKAQLASARVRYRMAEARGAIDVLRKHLAQLTGLKAENIDAEAESIPPLPEVHQDQDLPRQAVSDDPTIEAAQIRARAQLLRARGEHRNKWPEVDFATQYALLSNFNNYADFYRSFQRNNASIGVAVRFPFLNFSQRAHAQAADADALKAKNEAQATKNKVSEETLRLQRAVEQLFAAQQVAELESKIANSNLDSMQVKVNSGNGTLHELQDARDQSDQDFDALQDANFQLTKTRIALLRSTGEIDAWIGLPQ